MQREVGLNLKLIVSADTHSGSYTFGPSSMFFYNTCTSHSSTVYPFISLPRALLTVLTKHSSFPSSSLVLSSALMFFSLSLNRPLLSLPRQYSCLHVALSLPIPCLLCPPNWNYREFTKYRCLVNSLRFLYKISRNVVNFQILEGSERTIATATSRTTLTTP